jgi:ABC-type spermidine/putrescine transport system permease subunit I
MTTRTEELLNKYIDNELDSAGLAELNELLDKDENAVKELKAMKVVERSLRKMEFESSPANVTYDVMKKIASVRKVKRSDWFFWLSLGVLIIGTIVTLIYAFHNIQPEQSTVLADKTTDAVKNFIGDNTRSLDSLLRGVDVKLIGTVITLLCAITGYFIIETHRNFKNKLKSL